MITAAHLLRGASPERPVDVRIVEKSSTIGPGLAYRTPLPRHTLNNFAGRLSAVDGDPDHLLRWCAERGVPATPTSFLQRSLYGDYLADVLDTTPVPPGSLLRRDHGEVTDVRPEGDEVRVSLSSSAEVTADAVVLALGNPPPRRQPGFAGRSDRYVADPWSAHLPERIGAAEEVLLLGTGLTMVDVVAQLHEASPATRFTAVSRRGLLPTAHKHGSPRLHDSFNPGSGSLDLLLERVRAQIAEVEDVGGDWRDVVDSLRACANELWRDLPAADQDTFVNQVSRHWEIARHRMSPVMAAYIAGLQKDGVLRVLTIDEVDVESFDRVVNCTGPCPVPTPGWNPLVDTLLERGAIRPHRLGLGLDLDPSGRVIDFAGRIDAAVYAVGAARRGPEWEVAAIPDLRQQASRLASDLLGRRPSGAPADLVGVEFPA